MSTDNFEEKNMELKASQKLCSSCESSLSTTTTTITTATKPSNWITLNVGGRLFTTTRSTLVDKEPNSMLARMFSQEYGLRPSDLDSTGAYLIDRSFRYFEPILNYLRYGYLIREDNVNLEGILEEATYFGIEGLIPQLELLIMEKSHDTDPENAPLSRREVIAAIIQTPKDSELRFQGVNLAGADLRKLDLRNINFRFANLSRCNLSMANLTNCCIERVDLSYAIMDGAQMLSIRGSCANMEAASLRECNFEDPAGTRTNLENVNLKGACLEGSNMAGVNLRVANLRDGNLKNCNLRGAVLAGADLERCNLSGSDLQEANLRGANFKDAELELMLTPLHMSQAIR